MKPIKFHKSAVPRILNRTKTCTWRLNDDKDLQKGDRLSLCTPDGKEFCKAIITEVKETRLGDVTEEDQKGDIPYKSKEAMYENFSILYKIQAGPKTPVKIVRFEIDQEAGSKPSNFELEGLFEEAKKLKPKKAMTASQMDAMNEHLMS